MNRIKLGIHSCSQKLLQEGAFAQREIQPVPARLQLRHVRIALRIVDELMVRQVLQPIMVRAGKQREQAEPVGSQLVQRAIAEEDVMHALVRQAA